MTVLLINLQCINIKCFSYFICRQAYKREIKKIVIVQSLIRVSLSSVFFVKLD